jgi:hypothetical protein
MEEKYFKQSVADWVMTKCESWRNHYDSNYADKHEEYYRLWRGIWASEDSMRQSERSRIISPALQQAVESSVAEVEEATFGRGKWFDICDDYLDKDRSDAMYLRNKLEEDFKYTKVRKEVAECVLNAAVFGTGIGELVLEEVKEMKPATQPMMEGELEAVGVETRDRFVVKLRPVLPQNFLIDPVASSIDEALGVAIDEFVPIHQVEQDIEKGYYRDVDIELAATDSSLEPDQELSAYPEDKVRLTKYYGLVPKELFSDSMEEELDGEIVELIEREDDKEDTRGYVEAIVVIANGGQLLKLEENPYMMQDRPVVAFPWDVVPSRFWGRGVCEKGYNSQKALDTELRARIDALALSIHPMMAIDATRLPRGMKPEIRPGKMLLTNGNPAEVLKPFSFGGLDATSFNQAASLQNMVQQATGAVDTAGIPSFAGSEATAAGISMSLGAIIKRHKRTLINFQELFLLPMVTKTAHRYMQFDPDNYPVKDFKFTPSSSLGLIAREYEVTQLVQLLQTMGQDSPMYPMLIQAIVDNMNISNREELIQQLQKSQQPNPQEQQEKQMQLQVQLAKEQATAAALQAQAAEANERSNKYKAEVALMEYEAQTDRIKALSSNLKEGEADDKEFERRYKVAELLLKEQDIKSKQQPTMEAMNANPNGSQENNRPSQRGVQEERPAIQGNAGAFSGVGEENQPTAENFNG